MAEQQVDDGAATLREFRKVLKDYTVPGLYRREYIRVTLLTKWLESKATPRDRQVDILLEYAYRQSHAPRLPISADDICRDGEKCILVFSILLEIDCGKLIDCFESHDLVDKNLPIPLLRLGEVLGDQKSSRGVLVAEEFNRKQWAFCPAKFDFDRSRQYHQDMVIPICRREKINDKGGTARLWQIEVQEEFVRPRLRAKILHSRYESPVFGPVSTDTPAATLSSTSIFSLLTDSHQCYHFALKTIREGNAQLFKNEREAFQTLKV